MNPTIGCCPVPGPAVVAAKSRLKEQVKSVSVRHADQGADAVAQVTAARQQLADSAASAQWNAAQRFVVVVTVGLLGMRIVIADSLNITVGLVLSAILIPLWIRTIRLYRGATIRLVTGVLAVVSGLILTRISSTDHQVEIKHMVSTSMVVLTLLFGFGVVLWGRTLIRDASLVTAFGVGLTLGISTTSTGFLINPWRFGYSVPITVVVLGLAALLRSRWLELAAVLLLLIVSALNGARSTSAILLLAALFICWQMLPKTSTRRTSGMKTVLAVGVLGLVIYNFGQSLILGGSLGDDAQSRSQAQIDTTGSLILGGRPELAATANLMLHHPQGFGSGTLPSLDDLNVAKAGMAAINVDPNNGYVERFMFGNGFELHSTFGDLWANYGIVGLIFALTILLVGLRAFGESMARQAISGIVLFLTIKMIWNIFFSPLLTSVPLLTLLMALVLIPKLEFLERKALKTKSSPRRRRRRSRSVRRGERQLSKV